MKILCHLKMVRNDKDCLFWSNKNKCNQKNRICGKRTKITRMEIVFEGRL